MFLNNIIPKTAPAKLTFILVMQFPLCDRF